jgi:protein-L-isoaspartate(D-aspartate) O-methyltransferase
VGDLDSAFDAVPAPIYTHHERYGETVHRSAPESIRRERAALQARPGDRVPEIGTGSGYSGALLAHLCGPDGRVTSVDISEELIRRATAIHAECGVTGVDCRVGDGLAGYPAAAPSIELFCGVLRHGCRRRGRSRSWTVGGSSRACRSRPCRRPR